MSFDPVTTQRLPHITVNSESDSGGSEDNMRSTSLNSTQRESRQLIPISRGPYSNSAVAESSERLLAPSRARRQRSYQDLQSIGGPRSNSAMSSRRTSWSSDDGGRESRLGPYATPFDDNGSRSSSRGSNSDEEQGLNTQTVTEKYNVMPSEMLLLYPSDIEKDDYLHNPSPDDKDEKCDVFSKRGFMNVGGLALITIGILVLFIGYPALYVSPCELLYIFNIL